MHECCHKYAIKGKSCTPAWVMNWWRDQPQSTRDTVPLLCDWDLPVDQKGLCIFHSADSAFKKLNNFVGRFKDWITISFMASRHNLDEADSLDCQDFVFTACENGYDVGHPCIDLSEVKIGQAASFEGSHFKDEIWFNTAEFLKPVQFDNCRFTHDAHFEQARFRGRVTFNGCTFEGSSGWRETDFESSCQFTNCHFTGPAAYNGTTFAKYADFTNAIFQRAYFHSVQFLVDINDGVTTFDGARFEELLQFRNSMFAGEVSFLDCTFSLAEIIDTTFSPTRRVVFDRIWVRDTLIFKSTKEDEKIFNHAVSFELTAEHIKGRIIFENTNIFFISNWHQIRSLADPGVEKIFIGAGCKKYRVALEYLVPLDAKWKPLVAELAETFVLFYDLHGQATVSVNCECEYRSDQILVRYFADSSMPQDDFQRMLEKHVPNFMALLTDPRAYFSRQDAVAASASDKYVLYIDTYRKAVSIQAALYARIVAGTLRLGEMEELMRSVGAPGHNACVNIFQTINQIDIFSSGTSKFASGGSLTLQQHTASDPHGSDRLDPASTDRSANSGLLHALRRIWSSVHRS